MPGFQPIIYHDSTREEMRIVRIRIRPTSLWRFIPGLGPLVLFRLGAIASFRLDFRLLSQDVTVAAGEEGQLALQLWISGHRIHRKEVTFPYPRHGHDTFTRTDGFFCSDEGHAELTFHGSVIYTFYVWELAISQYFKHGF